MHINIYKYTNKNTYKDIKVESTHLEIVINPAIFDPWDSSAQKINPIVHLPVKGNGHFSRVALRFLKRWPK